MTGKAKKRVAPEWERLSFCLSKAMQKKEGIRGASLLTGRWIPSFFYMAQPYSEMQRSEIELGMALQSERKRGAAIQRDAAKRNRAGHGFAK